MRAAWLTIQVCVVLIGAGCGAAAAGEPHPQRPFMLWTREDIQRLAAKIQAEPWAKQRLERLLKEAPAPKDRTVIENYFLHLVTGDPEAEKHEKQVMLHFAEMLASPAYAAGRSVEIGTAVRLKNYDLGFRYDLFRDALNDEERRACESRFNRWVTMQLGGEYPQAWEDGYAMFDALMAVATADKRIVQAVFECKSGPKAYFDNMVDGCFSPAGCNPDMNVLGAMLLWCRGVERLGLNEYGWGYTGKTGGAMRRLLEGYYLAGDPWIDIPGGAPFYGRSVLTLSARLRRLNFFELQPTYMIGGSEAAKGGLGSRVGFTLPKLSHPRDVFRAPILLGRLRDGAGDWPPLIPFRNDLFYSYDKTPRDLVGMPQIEYNRSVEPLSMGIQWPLALELAHQRFPDAGLDYFLCRTRAPEDGRYTPSLFWGLDPIAVADTKPPAVKSMVFPGLGMALLRATEGPGFWDSPAPFAVLRLTDGKGEEIAGSALSLHSLHAFHRPIYRYVHPSRAVPPAGDTGKCHNTVVVDNGKRTGVGQATVRQRFDGTVKFVAVRSEPLTSAGNEPAGSIFPGVEMERALALTGEYLLDVFRVAGDREHTYDWLIHALGSAQPDQPAEWTPTEALSETLGAWQEHAAGSFDQRASYRMRYSFGDQHMLDTKGSAWSLNAVQTALAADPAKTVMGPEWYGRNVGARLTMLGEPGTRAFFAREVLGRRLTQQEQAQLEAIRFPLRLKGRDTRYDQGDHQATEIPIPPAGGETKVDEPAKALSLKDFKPVGQASEIHPETGGVVIVAERRAAKTLFVALHEPFEKMTWGIQGFHRIQQMDDAVAVAVRGRELSPVDDRILIRLGARAEEPLTLGDGTEQFTFKGFAYVRVAPARVTVSGDLSAMKLKVKGAPTLVVNGQEKKGELNDGYLSYAP